MLCKFLIDNLKYSKDDVQFSHNFCHFFRLLFLSTDFIITTEFSYIDHLKMDVQNLIIRHI